MIVENEAWILNSGDEKFVLARFGIVSLAQLMI